MVRSTNVRERVEHWMLYNADCIMLFQLDEGNMQRATREFYPRRENSRDALMDANAGEKTCEWALEKDCCN